MSKLQADNEVVPLLLYTLALVAVVLAGAIALAFVAGPAAVAVLPPLFLATAHVVAVVAGSRHKETDV